MEPTYDHGNDFTSDLANTTAHSQFSYHDNVVSMDLTLAMNSDTIPNMDITSDPFAEEVRKPLDQDGRG